MSIENQARRWFDVKRTPSLILVLVVATAAFGAIAYTFNFVQRPTMVSLPPNLTLFSVTDPPVPCARWKDYMPRSRAPGPFKRYIAARELLYSKAAWEHTREENGFIFDEVSKAANDGDWGARALLATFYLQGLGPLETTNFIKRDGMKAVEIARQAVAAGLPWGYFDLGVAHESGYGGANYDKDLAWAYYKEAARRGSPYAQMALAEAYAKAGMREVATSMIECAFRQGHADAAYDLSIKASVQNRFAEEVALCQEGVKFGGEKCAISLSMIFEGGTGASLTTADRRGYQEAGFLEDHARAQRYRQLRDALELNPDLRFPLLDKVLPLPPAEIKPWKGVVDVVAAPTDALPTY